MIFKSTRKREEEKAARRWKIDEKSMLNRKRNSLDRADVSGIFLSKFLIFLQIVFATIQIGVSENAVLRKINCADASDFVFFYFDILLYFESTKPNRIHRFDIFKHEPSEKNLQKRSMRGICNKGENRRQVVF